MQLPAKMPHPAASTTPGALPNALNTAKNGKMTENSQLAW